MNDRFIDTSILVYRHGDEGHREALVHEILTAGGVISVQVLNEYANVLRKKLRADHQELSVALEGLRSLFSVVPLGIRTHEIGLRIMGRYNYSVYDSMIAASAIEAGCSTLLTEDFAEGQVIEGSLTIVNPFKPRG